MTPEGATDDLKMLRAERPWIKRAGPRAIERALELVAKIRELEHQLANVEYQRCPACGDWAPMVRSKPPLKSNPGRRRVQVRCDCGFFGWIPGGVPAHPGPSSEAIARGR